MFALIIDTDSFAWLFQNWGIVQWSIVAAIGVLVGGKFVPAGLLTKVRSWFQRGILDDDPFQPSPDVVDDMPLLIHQMRLCVCDEVPTVRDGCNKHLDEMEQLLSGTEIDANE